MKWLNDRRIVYRRDPITDVPTYTTDTYSYYANGTYQSYNLFNSKSKITTYKSLKWHYLVLYYLNEDIDLEHVFRFIANKENGFVTFFIKNKILEEIIRDVLMQGGEPPVNRLRKIIFKDYSGLSFAEKMTIVGKLSGRQKLDTTDIYESMVALHDMGEKITNSKLARLLGCSIRTIQRHSCVNLKREKQQLNEEI
tara:strand:- start:1450 stop:2037 length:588 start_codon:yes stop_codon:yes gene_type:complete